MDYLNSLNSLGSVPGLDSIKELLKRLGNPQNELHVIHIAGTNGKGSTGAFIDKILVTSGYKTGRYSSPAVMDPLEIIRISEQNIDEKDFENIIEQVKASCDGMMADGLNHPTRFEVETAAAFLYFSQQKVDVAIIECGMGGLLDATNVFERVLCSVITSISPDHMSFLGDTIEEIAKHKAGIIKEKCRVVTSNSNKTVLNVLEKRAKQCHTKLVKTGPVENVITDDNFNLYFSYGNLCEIKSGLIGAYQVENAALAIETVKSLDLNVTDEKIRKGIELTRWEGRFEKIGDNPVFIVDGAHNPDGAGALAESLKTYIHKKNLTFLIGIFKDKDIYGILNKVMCFAKKAVVIETPDNARAMKCKELAKIISDNYDVEVSSFEDVAEGVRHCYEITAPDSAIIAFGSLSNLKKIKNEVCLIDNRRS